MSASLRPMTADEFLDWEERQELRYEFDGLTIEAMVGGTLGHTHINDNLTALMKAALRGKPCRYYSGNVKLNIGEKYRYPDGMVVCVPFGRTATYVTEATVVFEVLSYSTAMKDASVKNDEYRSIATVQRYVMLEQDRIAATVCAREDGEWIGRRLVGADAVLNMPEIGVGPLLLGQFYEGLDMEQSAI